MHSPERSHVAAGTSPPLYMPPNPTGSTAAPGSPPAYMPPNPAGSTAAPASPPAYMPPNPEGSTTAPGTMPAYMPPNLGGSTAAPGTTSVYMPGNPTGTTAAPEGTTPGEVHGGLIVQCGQLLRPCIPNPGGLAACLIARQSVTHFCLAAGPSPPASSPKGCAAGTTRGLFFIKFVCPLTANSTSRPHDKVCPSAVPVTLYNQGDSTSAYNIDATISVPNDCMCHDISQSGTSGVSFSAPSGATVTLYKGFGCQPIAALRAENNAQCFHGNHELPSTDSTCDSFSASSLQAASLDNELHSIMICSGKPAHAWCGCSNPVLCMGS